MLLLHQLGLFSPVAVPHISSPHLAMAPAGEMGSIEQQKRQAMAEFRRAELSRRALRALLSASSFCGFCLLASVPSWLPSLLHHANLHFSLLLIQLPDLCWVDRKAMFLLCNLILVVIARDSGLLASFMPEGGAEAGSAGSAGSLQVVALGKTSKPEEEEEGEDEEEKEEGEEEDEWHDMVELNKRFDEFIEKVKRDRELEALQMVMV